MFYERSLSSGPFGYENMNECRVTEKLFVPCEDAKILIGLFHLRRSERFLYEFLKIIMKNSFGSNDLLQNNKRFKFQDCGMW